MKATEQNFPVVLFIIMLYKVLFIIMLYKVVLTFGYVDEILKCERLSEKHCLLYIWDLTLSYLNSFWIDFGSSKSSVPAGYRPTKFVILYSENKRSKCNVKKRLLSFCENVSFTVNLTLFSLRSEPLAFTKGY